MSSRCQCSFSGQSDTLVGRHRDPISSDKVWLDFAVRELSRVAAGKARGQEAVWRSQCKPAWWDSQCPLPWKNPTANPKDSKDTLKTKFECLVQHLRNVGQLPREMEREIELWEADQKAQVFMLTSFSSLLWQASNLHGLLEETCHKMEESGTPSVDDSILNDLQSCLTACVGKLGTMKRKQQGDNNPRPRTKPCTGNKRPRSSADTDGPSHSPRKHQKVSPSPSNTPPLLPLPAAPSVVVTSPVPSSSTPESSPSQSSPASADQDQTRMLMAALQRQILQKQTPHTAGAAPSMCYRPRPKTPASSKAGPCPSTPSRARGSEKTRQRGWGQGTAPQALDSTVCQPASSACLPALVPQHPLSSPVPVPEMAESAIEFRDFLNLDLESVEDFADCQFLTDCQFMDSLLRGPSTESSVDLTTLPHCPTPPSCPDLSPAPSLSPASSLVQNDAVELEIVANHSSHDPFLGLSLSPSVLSESSSSHVDPSQTLVVGEVMDPVVQDTESGYSSESSGETSHRTSLDSQTTDSVHDFELDSPYLEAFLNSM